MTLRDSITIFRNARKPQTPTTIVPPNGKTVAITGTLLKAGPFKSEHQKAFHAAAHWQVSESEDFEKLTFEKWKQHENWYYKENRQKDDDLTDEITDRLRSNTTYYWRVRYRDQNLNWSDWSKTAHFNTQTH